MELAHHHYRATLAAAGVKRGKLPAPLHVTRPDPWAPEPEPDVTAPTRRQRRDGRRHATTVAEVASVLSQAFPKRG